MVIELRIEEFKPEFVGKMKFYLSAMDDQRRHEPDGPSIGITLCKGKNEVVVEYALRDSAKPMGVAEYRLSTALPEPLRAELPTVAEFARKSPLISLVKLHIEIERELRTLVEEAGFFERPLSIGATLAELERKGKAPHTTRQFQGALRLLNQAAHGADVEGAAVIEAADIAARFLADLRSLRAGDAH